MSPSFLRILTLVTAAVFTLPASAQTLTSTPVKWSWPAIPGCLADPGTSTPGATDYASPVCTVYGLLIASGQSDFTLISARRMNAEMDGVLYPAFTPGTEVVTFVLTPSFNTTFTGPNQLVRVSSSTIGAQSGSWWTTLSAITVNGQLLDAAAITARLALPASPSCIAYADSVQPGIRAYMGVVSPAFAQPGGNVEFWFPPSAVTATHFAQVPGATCNIPPPH